MTSLTDALKKKYQTYGQLKINRLFIKAVENGDLELIKYLLTSTELPKNANVRFNDNYAILIACQGKHLDILKYILTSPELKEHADIFAPHNFSMTGLSIACCRGYLDIVKFLMTAPELKAFHTMHKEKIQGLVGAALGGHLDIVKYFLTDPIINVVDHISSANYDLLFWPCANGHLDIVKYLLNFPALHSKLGIHVRQDIALRWAAERGHLEVVTYLLTSPDLKEHADIHAYDENDQDRTSAFSGACKNKKFDVVQYLLSFNGDKAIHFEDTEYNLQWAMTNDYRDIVNAMVDNLYVNNIEYFHAVIHRVFDYFASVSFEHLLMLKHKYHIIDDDINNEEEYLLC